MYITSCSFFSFSLVTESTTAQSAPAVEPNLVAADAEEGGETEFT